MVFQIVDDLLDIMATDEELGKPAGHDMEEGVYTLPVLLTLSAGDSAAKRLHEMLGVPLHGGDLADALSIVRNGGGLAGALESARNYVAIAEAECDRMPASPATDALRRAPQALLDSLL
jgi:heptaprenyl diphosphate synthase